MAGSIRICLIADNFLEDFAQCVASIRAHTQTPISIFASGKENQSVEAMFPDESVTWQKNKLGWGHSVNHFLNTVTEKYVVIMDPSTNFTGDAITPVLEKLDEGYQGVGWRGGLMNIEDEWRSVDDRGVVAILDSRITTKRYGSILLNTMPPLWRTSDGEVVRESLRRLAQDLTED